MSYNQYLLILWKWQLELAVLDIFHNKNMIIQWKGLEPVPAAQSCNTLSTNLL